MKKALAIVLSLVLVVSNISLTYATHFCGGEAIASQLMLGAQDLSCGMIIPESTCESQNTNDCEIPSEMDANCCDNQYVQLSVDDNFNTVSSLELPNMEFVVAFVHTFILAEFVDNAAPNEFLIEAPPLIDPDVQVLYQVFLI